MIFEAPIERHRATTEKAAQKLLIDWVIERGATVNQQKICKWRNPTGQEV